MTGGELRRVAVVGGGIASLTAAETLRREGVLNPASVTLTNAEATGAEVLDSYFPENQFATVIHASSKVCEGSWQWQPVATFKPDSRPAKDNERLAEEVLRG